MEIQHFSHQHHLAFCDEAKDGVCHGCERSIFGPAYGCTLCQYFIHKSCGELPQVIQHHPFHPTHPLTLLAKPPYRKRCFKCNVCKGTCSGFTFHCSECKFDLDPVCAMLSPSMDDKDDDQRHIQHFSHRHPLRKVKCHVDCHASLCNWCAMPINGVVYICFECNFFIHKSCTELPQDFQIQHFSHQHPLALCYGNGVCSACKDSISGPAYGCTQCQYLLHKSCGELPQLIQYPFHPTHPLTLLAKAPYRWRKFDCSMCTGRHFAFTYHCSECEFDVDISCSKMRPSTLDENEMQDIHHFSHPHPLIAITLSGCTSFVCSACEGTIKDLAYACWQCTFIIHKSCSDLPKEIQHQFHPRHRLTLLAEAPYIPRDFDCNACDGYFAGFTYHCFQCEFDLDIFCSTIKPLSDHKNHEKRIQHLSHRHPLFKVALTNENDDIFSCSLCKEPSDNVMYVCFKCKYFIHMSCAEFPGEIRHPFHPQHLLTLCAKLPSHLDFLNCYACQLTCTYLAFHCSQCNFIMHFSCALFMPTIHNEEHKQKIQHFSHQHPLILVTLFENDYNFKCSLCDQIINGSIYVCIKCKFFIHKSCADLVQKICHPFHSAHPLSLIPPAANELYDCSLCKSRCDGFIFQCSKCLFQMHVHCAITTRTISIEQDSCEPLIQHFSHPHPLIPIKAALFPLDCTTCYRGLGVTGYACFQCMFFLGKSCFEFPQEILKPIHRHPLTILTMETYNRVLGCTVCGPVISFCRFVYHCADCDFKICPKCETRPTIKYELHEHLLVYMDKSDENFTYECEACGGNCTECFLQCVECDTNLHVQCIPALPVTGKHRSHRHLLSLTDPLPEDDTNEYYCDACEKERNPKHSVYYCAKCEFVAHIECVTSEVVLPENEESSVACRLMDAGIEICDTDSYDSEEEEADEESDAGEEEEEESDFNISRLFDDRVSKDIDREGTEFEDTLEEKAEGEEQADQETCDVTKEEVEANQESDISTDSSEVEREIEALTRKLKTLQQRRKKSHVVFQAQM